MNAKCFFPFWGLGLITTMAQSANAQQFDINWFTIDGGGGTSLGGPYELSGTLGQPDAGFSMTGGSFSIQGGFWSVVDLVQTPGAPLLGIQTLPSGDIRVFWPLTATGFVLEQTTGLTGMAESGWGQVSFPYQTNATEISITVPMPIGSRFYRLHKLAP